MGNFDLITKTLTETAEKYKAKMQGLSIKRKAKESPEDEIVVTVENFSKYTRTYGLGRIEPWLHEENMDVGGGVISIADIDKIRDFPNAKNVAISGLHQDTFEYFIRTYGKQFKSIFFFKNKLVQDWSLLGTLPDLEFIHWFFNQRIDKFWDMSQNTALQGISIEDFSRLKTISGIEKAPNLKYFYIGDAVWSTTEIETLSPFRNTEVEHLVFSGKTVVDKDFSFVKDMKSLRVLDLSTNLLTVEQYAWIEANCPSLEEGPVGPVQIQEHGDEKIVYPYGRGKRSFNLQGNENRLKKVEAAFWNLVDKMKDAPYPISNEL